MKKQMNLWRWCSSSRLMGMASIAVVAGLLFVGEANAQANGAQANGAQASGAQASGAQASGASPTDLFPQFSLDGLGGNASGGLTNDDPYVIEADYVSTGKADELLLRVRLKLARRWHVYSLTQPEGGPPPTQLTIQSDRIDNGGDWKPSEPPAKSVSEEFGGITIEEHTGAVTFSRVAKIQSGAPDAANLGEIAIQVTGLTCIPGGACLPIEEVVMATYAGEAKLAQNSPPLKKSTSAPIQGLLGNNLDDLFNKIADGATPMANKPSRVDQPGDFRDGDYVVRWRATVSPSVVAPGGTATLSFTAIPDETYHVYTSAVNDADAKTNFVVTQTSGLKFGPPKTDAPTIDYDSEIAPGVTYHPGTVTWTIKVDVPEDADEGKKLIKGGIAYQACQESSCQEPAAIRFETEITIQKPAAAGADVAATGEVQLASAKRAGVLDDAATIAWVAVPELIAPTSDYSFSALVLFAFLGGVILNFMPCVLPIVGLKVMSFVQQGGENRVRIFMLNMVYALGILAVFGVLTFLAVALSFSWGQQFTYFPVRMGLTVLLFAMALSYLGVWEIPAPGMASSKGSQQLQKREGYTGAFFKGAFATVLATPCSGPMLGTILGLTIAFTPMQTTVVIMSVGVGMALPYLIIGLWPRLISWLPKPGTWMETLKEFMAFLFLGTVAFFFHQFSDGDKLPVFVTLIGVWFGCWIIGKVPSWSDLGPRVASWVGGVAAASIIGLGAFQYLGPEPPPTANAPSIAWQPYNEAELQRLQSEGRTVMIDFTAKWCINCIANYKFSINTDPTRELIEELNAVPMLADWTDYDPVIKDKLAELQSRSIPLLAIYPGQSPNEPIVLRDLVSQSAVLEALKQAGPSKIGSSKIGTSQPETKESTTVARRRQPAPH